MNIIVSYLILAVIAIAANIGSQDLTIQLYRGAHNIEVSVLVGTAVGLLVKYLLDKRYIFKFETQNLFRNTQTFALYALMGVVTTLIFWGFEFGFDRLFQTRELRYLGGMVGLSVGYYMKYHLDKRFVFKRRGSGCDRADGVTTP